MDKKKIFKVLAAILLFFIVVIFFFEFRHKIMHLKMWRIKKFVLSYGDLSILVIFLIYALKPLVIFFPIFMLSMVVGNIYGPFNGTIINLVGAFLSSTIAFYIARFLGKDFVDNIIKGKAVKVEDSIAKHGFKIIMLMRLSFMFPFDILSYSAGLTKIKYKDFILGTMIGSVLEIVSYAFAGHNMNKPLSMKFLLPFLGIIVMALFFSFILKKSKNNT